MKIFTIALVLLSFAASAQKVVVIKKDSSRMATRVSATSSNEIYTSDGTVRINDIAYVDIQEEDASLVKFLEAHQIRYTTKKEPYFASSPVRQQNQATELTIEGLQLSLDKFARQRTTGKFLEIAGMLGVVGASVWAANDSKGKDTNSIQMLAIGSAVISTTGFIIDLDAARHLKRKK